MNETDARQVLLVRAVETAAAAAAEPAWSATDASWAADEARRRVGEHASAEAFLATRATLALQRLRERGIRWNSDPLRPGRRAWGLGLVIGGLLLLGAIVGNVLGPDRRLNLLAPPVWGVIAWNLLVYLALAISASSAVLALRRAPTGAAPAMPRHSASLEAVRRISALSARWSGAKTASIRACHLVDWLQHSAPLQAHRLAAAMHAAAALLGLAIVVSMYFVGLAFDYRAGWDSTWLEAGQVERGLRSVFGPFATFAGIALPDAAELARLRWSEGSSGERAGRWIHLYALVLLVFVVMPRTALAAWAALRARRAARNIALPLHAPYFRALLRQGPRQRWPVSVLPYSYRLGGAEQSALDVELEAALGDGAQAQLLPSLPLGAEDELARHLPAALTDKLALLFAATATPERETHGAFVQAVAAQRPPGTVFVLVDESGLRRQLGTAAAAAPRLQQRREAWQRLMQSLSLPLPHFIDLGPHTRSAAPQT